MSLLPEQLVRGRAYFIDDEQVIVIDHGQGPIIYGGKPGPQGQAGEPLPQIQDQIDHLSAAALETQVNMWTLKTATDATIADVESRTASELVSVREDIEAQAEQASKDLAHYRGILSDKDSELQSQIDNHTSAILSTIMTLQDKFKEYDSAIAILTKTISNLYPNPEAETSDPLDGEVIVTDSGSWKIEQTILDDGTLVFELDAQQLYIDTLSEGSKVDYDGSTWTVSEYSKDGDMITIRLRP